MAETVAAVREKKHALERSPLAYVNDPDCPHCALAQTSLAARFPQVAASPTGRSTWRSSVSR